MQGPFPSSLLYYPVDDKTVASESDSLSQAAMEHFCWPVPKSQDSILLITGYFWKGAWKTKMLNLQDLIMLSNIFPFSSH